KFGLNHVQSASIGFCFAAYAPLVRIFISLALHTFWPITHLTHLLCKFYAKQNPE
ncbi:hypothetical protein HMPREF1578_01200, partial [Gardnerella pickettii JCP8017B]